MVLCVISTLTMIPVLADRMLPDRINVVMKYKKNCIRFFKLLQKSMFCRANDALLHDKRWPFVMQKTTFRKNVCYYVYF